METVNNGAANGNKGGNNVLKALLVAGALAATLTFSAGLATIGVAAGVAGAAVGGVGAAYGACQRVEIDLAADLGIGAATLRSTDGAAIERLLAARETSGALTAREARVAGDRADAYTDCRDFLGAMDEEWADAERDFGRGR